MKPNVDQLMDCQRPGAALMPGVEKTHCPNGHELSGDNVRVRKNKGYLFRICVVCKIASNRAWKQSNPEQYKKLNTRARRAPAKPERSAVDTQRTL